MESTIQDRNLGRYDPVAVGKLIGEIIQGKRRIFTSGRNQIKIWCEDRNDANILFASEALRDKGYRTFLPDSMVYKKGFIRIQPEHSVAEVVENMDLDKRELIISARRRINRRDNQYSDIIDLTFNTSYIPRFIFTWSVRIFVTPSISIPKDAPLVSILNMYLYSAEQLLRTANTVLENTTQMHATIRSPSVNATTALSHIRLLQETAWSINSNLKP